MRHEKIPNNNDNFIPIRTLIELYENIRKQTDRESSERELTEYITNTYLKELNSQLNHRSVEDVLHNIVIKAIEVFREGKIKNIHAIKAYIDKIVQGCIVEEIRRRQRQKKHFSSIESSLPELESLNHQVQQSPRPDKNENNLLEETINQIGRLSCIEKQLLIKFYVENKTREEIMTEMNLGDETKYRNLKSRAIGKLKKTISLEKIRASLQN